MTPMLMWLIGMLAVVIVFRLLRPTLAFVLAPQIAAGALSRQPDVIHLEPAADGAWSDPDRRDRLTREIAALGFAEAGTYTVCELPAVKLRLFANGPESLYAIVYEHPRRGSWFEFACRFTDGSGSTWTSLPATGLEPRPGHPVRHLPNATVAALWQAVKRERPAKPAHPAAVSSAVGDFEQVWAESIAWRKQNGISRLEVARVGARKAA